jgi:hypothetical protein
MAGNRQKMPVAIGKIFIISGTCVWIVLELRLSVGLELLGTIKGDA